MQLSLTRFARILSLQLRCCRWCHNRARLPRAALTGAAPSTPRTTIKGVTPGPAPRRAAALKTIGANHSISAKPPRVVVASWALTGGTLEGPDISGGLVAGPVLTGRPCSRTGPLRPIFVTHESDQGIAAPRGSRGRPWQRRCACSPRWGEHVDASDYTFRVTAHGTGDPTSVGRPTAGGVIDQTYLVHMTPDPRARSSGASLFSSPVAWSTCSARTHHLGGHDALVSGFRRCRRAGTP